MGALSTKSAVRLTPKVDGSAVATAAGIEAATSIISDLFSSVHTRPRAPAAVNPLGLLAAALDQHGVDVRNRLWRDQ